MPAWLLQRLHSAGGRVPFATYMDWVLHDPHHGAYGSGRLRIGPGGDFATAPSLGPDFAALLLVQLADWLERIREFGPEAPLALVEAGPGEGTLAAELARGLAAGWPQLAARTELVLVEPNPGMVERQRQRLHDCPLPCRWMRLDELAGSPVRGVVVAHEVLDALAVQRIVWNGRHWCEQMVAADGGSCGLRLEPGDPLGPEQDGTLTGLGLLPPSPQRPAGWCTELHPGVAPWLAACGAGLAPGVLLVIDYALEASRYYAPQRGAGTLMAYRGQRASSDPLGEPGRWDLTAHLCLDSLEAAATAAGWQRLGGCRQGEALLALGLAGRLHGLQRGTDLATALQRREALLRLVDPAALGDFRWLAWVRGLPLPTPRFLQPPPP